MIKDKQVRERIAWLDWMKVWAILSIIWGHFFSEGYIYLYVYSVQVFCVISGFLYRKSSKWYFCISKCFWGLFVPTVIMSVIMHMEAYLRCVVMGEEYHVSIPWFVRWFMLGHRWCMGPCWYFYSLIVMRLIMQVLPEKRWVYVLLFVVLSSGAIYLSSTDIEVSNANTNVLVCMPFFIIGVLLRPLKELLNGLRNYYVEVTLLVLSMFIVFFCGNYNGYVWMYLCEYGNYYTLFIIGGVAGTVMLYVVSLWLSRLPYRNVIMTLSNGSIVIIGLHIIIVRRLTELPDRMWSEDLFFSCMILMAFVPIVRIIDLFFPILLGHKPIIVK